MSFISHFFFPGTFPEIAESKAVYKKTGKELDQLKDSIALYSPLAQRITLLNAQYKAEKKVYAEVKAQHNIFGYNGLERFLWCLGLGITITICGLYIMSKAVKEIDTSTRNGESLFGVAIGTIGFYFFVWIVYPENDLPYHSYVTIMLLIAVVASTAAYFLVLKRWLTIANIVSDVKKKYEKK